MAYETLRLNVSEGVATITLARPKSLNALNPVMARELFDTAIQCTTDPAIRAVVLTGEGKAFCAGGDLSVFAESGDAVDRTIHDMATHFHAAIAKFARMDAPLIAAVNGVAAGGGLSLVTACDLAIAAESATFTMAYTAAGLVPDGSSTFFLSRLIGLRRAQELVLTNRRLSAQEALDWGLVNRVVPDAEFADTVQVLAAQLAAGPTQTLGHAKRLLWMGTSESLETQMEAEAQGIARSAASADGREGVTAFVEKRKPNFTGA